MLNDGRILEKHIDHAIGSRERPMSDADLDEKFHGLADNILGAEQASRLLALAWSIEELPDAAEICRAAAPEAQTQRRPVALA